MERVTRSRGPRRSLRSLRPRHSAGSLRAMLTYHHVRSASCSRPRAADAHPHDAAFAPQCAGGVVSELVRFGVSLALVLLGACSEEQAPALGELPSRLSEAGLFTNIATKEVAPDLLFFEPANVLW